MTSLIQMPDVQSAEEVDLQNMPTEVDALFESMRQFTLRLIDWDGEDMQKSVLADMVPHLTPEARSQLIFLLLTVGHSDVNCELDTAGKQFAVVLAETMGPDWAQWLYNFAKVVTKLA